MPEVTDEANLTAAGRVYQHGVRDEAVRIVDGRYGYSIEFGHEADAASRQQKYDVEEARLRVDGGIDPKGGDWSLGDVPALVRELRATPDIIARDWAFRDSCGMTGREGAAFNEGWAAARAYFTARPPAGDEDVEGSSEA